MSRQAAAVGRSLFFRARPLPGFALRPAPQAVASDYIGPPDRDSNLRPMVRRQPAGFERTETDAEFELRTRRVQCEEWNQAFWSRHNQRFVEEKEEFVRVQREAGAGGAGGVDGGADAALSADKMSEFYKEFLDKNWRMHFLYNVSWYMKNAELLMLSAQVAVQRMLLRRQQAKEAAKEQRGPEV